MRNKYMITRWLLAAAVPAVLLTACIKDIDTGDYPGTDESSGGEIRFEIGFADPAATAATAATAAAGRPETRVATDSDFKSAWEAGDEIGVFACSGGGTLSAAASDNYIHNVKLTYNGSSWTQAEPLYWPTKTALDFYAYYPYDASATDPTAIAFNVKTDQRGTTSGKSNYNLSDLLTAKSAGNAKGSTVQLTFSHALAMVEVAIPGGKGWIGGSEKLTVTLRGVKPGATLDLSAVDGSTPGSGISVPATGSDAAGITMYRMAEPIDGNYLYRALVPAQTVRGGRSLFFFDNGGQQLFTDSALASDLILTAGWAEKFERTLIETGTLIPAGTFQMGSPTYEPDREQNETQHLVTLTEAFYMSKYPITNAQFAVFLKARGIISIKTGTGDVSYTDNNGKPITELKRFIYDSSTTNEGYAPWGLTWDKTTNQWIVQPGYEDHPALFVTWYGAKAFADYYGYRLPTEAQWEYACRGGQTESLPFGIGNGRKLTGDMATFRAEWPYDSDHTPPGTYYDGKGLDLNRTTTPVGNYPYANGYGLYDMHGNVREWCADWYDDNYYSTSPDTDPTGPVSGSDRVLRGGYSNSMARDCRSADRDCANPGYGNSAAGFRVVVVP